MNKLAKTKYGIHPLLEKRWSPRAFREDAVEKEKLQRIFEAAQWSPSCMNEQSWRFIVGEKGNETYNKIFDSLTENNQRWVKHVPVLIVSLAKKYFERNGKENLYFMYDTGQSVAHLTFQAMHEGLYVHQMGGFNHEKIKNYFNVPEEYDVMSVIAIGYIANPDILDEDIKLRELEERERKDLSEIVFTESFGKAWK